MLGPDDIASRTFGTSFRGYDPDEVRRFLGEVAAQMRDLLAGTIGSLDTDQAASLLGEEAARVLAAARASAAAVETRAEERAAELLREAQEEALRLRATVDAERDRAYAEGAERAESLVKEAEWEREQLLRAARREADELLAEARAAREHVLRDLARRRRQAKTQVERLHAAREKLLGALNDMARLIDEARGRLVVALPEARLAADAAARRAEAEPETTVEQLEAELEAFRLAGVGFGRRPATKDGEGAAEAEEAGEAEAAEAAEAAPAPSEQPEPEAAPEAEEVGPDVQEEASSAPRPELHPVDLSSPFELVRVLPAEEPTDEPEPTEDGGPWLTSPSAEPEPADVADEELVAAATEGEVEATDEPEPTGDGGPRLTSASDETEAPDAVAAPVGEVRGEPLAAAEPEPEEPAAEVEEAEDGPVAEGPHEPPAEQAVPSPPRELTSETVDALFARLRARREARTAAAAAVLARDREQQPVEAPVEPAGAVARNGDEPAAEVDDDGAAAVEPAGSEPVAAVAEEAVEGMSGEPEPAVDGEPAGERTALLARRDELLAEPAAALARRLKRLLADEQNAVLDALRRADPGKAVVPDPGDLAARWADAATDDLRRAAAAGAAFLAGDGQPPGAPTTEVVDIAADLAAAVAAPLAERLARAVAGADGDPDLAADAVRTVCREWRTRRLADGVDHAVRVAFGRGTLAAAAAAPDAPGIRLCWIVDDGGSPCPDAEDNALAGAVAVGEPYPTGHTHPPAHPGCRCVLALAPAPAPATTP